MHTITHTHTQTHTITLSLSLSLSFSFSLLTTTSTSTNEQKQQQTDENIISKTQQLFIFLAVVSIMFGPYFSSAPPSLFIIHVLIGRTGDYDPSTCLVGTQGMGFMSDWLWGQCSERVGEMSKTDET